MIKDGVLIILDLEHKLLAHVSRAKNRLYTLVLDLAIAICLKTKIENVAWRWRARFEHLHFRALCALSQKKMVNGILDIE